MRHEGDVSHAREHFYSKSPQNLRFLLSQRYAWMNDCITPTMEGIEVGEGTGVYKELIRNRHLLLTDYADHDWLDVKEVDALNTPFENNRFDFVISSNMIH